jgi:hypothetical protein
MAAQPLRVRLHVNPTNIKSGESVTANLCQSDGTIMGYNWNFGDGVTDNDSGTPCNILHTYTATTSLGDVRATSTDYSLTGCIEGIGEDQDCDTVNITVTPPTPSCETDPPSVDVPTVVGTVDDFAGGARAHGTSPPELYFDLVFTTSASDGSGSGIASVEYLLSADAEGKGCSGSFAQTSIGSATTAPYTVTLSESDAESFASGSCGGTCYRTEARARAVDKCSNSTTSDPYTFYFTLYDSCGSSFGASGGSVTWSSLLDARDATGHVLLDDSLTLPAGRGRFFWSTPLKDGRHRVEATLTAASGPGTWRFELPSGMVEVGSLRVLQGDVAYSGPEAVVFRLTGKPGERVIFSFSLKR